MGDEKQNIEKDEETENDDQSNDNDKNKESEVQQSNDENQSNEKIESDQADDNQNKDEEDQPNDESKNENEAESEVKEEETESIKNENEASPEIENNTSNISAYSQSAQQNDAENDEHSHWLKGEKYILIDAGGGTCDVACHEILRDFAVQEIVHPTGGPWGSTYIDDYFVDLISTIFDSEWIAEFKKEDPSAYTELIDNFRVAKQEFWNAEKGHKDNDDSSDNNADKWHNVQLPFDFCTFLEEKVESIDEEVEGCDLETMVEQTEIMKKTGFTFMEDEYLRLNYFIWTTQLFDKVVD